MFLNTSAQVGIGTIAPHPSAVLEVESTTLGFLPPRLSENEKNSIQNPAEGLIIYNTSLNCLEVYKASFWYNFCCVEKTTTSINSLVAPLVHVNFEDLNLLKVNNGSVAQVNSFINQIESNEGNSVVFDEIHNNEAGFNTAQDTLFKLIDNPNGTPQYSSRRHLRRTVVNSGRKNFLESDITDIENSDFELFVVLRFNEPGAQQDYASVFHTRKFTPGNFNGIDASFQIGTGHSLIPATGCNNTFYGIRIGHQMVCGDSQEKRVAIDGKFHIFNITYQNSTKTFTLRIDNELKDTRVLADVNKQVIRTLSLFSNRAASSAAPSEIASLVLYQQILQAPQRTLINQNLVCSYSEL
jgi:hypothetical protein